MQTYYSALPLMPPASLLSKKYSAISRPSLKLWESSYSRIINHPQVELPKLWYCSTSCDDIIALSLCEGGIAFFDTRTRNEIGSRIPTPNRCYLIAFSPDGKWIVIQGASANGHKYALDLWNVKTRTHVKTIEIESEYSFEHITYSSDGEKVMVVTRWSLSLDRLVFIWDVKTDKPLKQLVVHAADVAISPDGSQIAIHDSDELGIKIIDVSTEHIDRQVTLCDGSLWISNILDSRIVWSPNGQFLASASRERFETKLHLLSLTRGSAQVPILTQLECSSTKHVCQLAFSPDSSKVVAVLCDNSTRRMTLSIWCTRSGAQVGTSYEMTSRFAALSFAADGQDILICYYDSFTLPNSTLYHFSASVVSTHLKTYMNHPPKFHPPQTLHIIQYSHHISGAINDYASHVAADGWILNTKGEREIWTPWANYELSCSCKPPQNGRTQYRTLEVKKPQTKTVVMIYVIAFEQEDVSNEFQEAVVSVE